MDDERGYVFQSLSFKAVPGTASDAGSEEAS
jgi:hypothetical protein